MELKLIITRGINFKRDDNRWDEILKINETISGG